LASSLRPVPFSRSEAKHHQVNVQVKAHAFLSGNVGGRQPLPALF